MSASFCLTLWVLKTEMSLEDLVTFSEIRAMDLDSVSAISR
jgi:hypothetical protein